jgi:hypothetical protein
MLFGLFCIETFHPDPGLNVIRRTNFSTSVYWFFLIDHNIILFSALRDAGAQSGYQMPSFVGKPILKNKKPDPAELNRVLIVDTIDRPV